jgi:pimeloyl-ACP methyl ester carboxylesterase
MRTPHRVTISRHHKLRAFRIPTSATEGSHAPKPLCPSTGVATERRGLPPDFAAPVLIHSTADETVDAESSLEAHSVLLIHGQPGSSLIWTHVLPLLRGYGLHTLAVDRPGYGQSGGEALDQFANAAALSRLLDEQQRSPAVIVGHSLGAGIALALAATAPRHVRALVLVAPAAGPQSISLTDRVLAAPILGPSLAWLGFRAAGLALHIAPLRQRILGKRVGLSVSDSQQVVHRLTYGATWRSFIIEQQHLVTDFRRLDLGLGQLDCPIVIVGGNRDRIATGRVITALSRRLPGSDIITTDAGHLIPIDAPDAVANAVLRALRCDYRTSLARRRADDVRQ